MARPERDSVLHTWCVPAEWQAPTVIGGEGAWFRDDRGRRLLDMSSLSECCNLGHQHPAVVEAIRDQASRLCFTTSAWGAQPRAELAEALLEQAGFEGGRVYFTLGGADANESAIKIARLARQLPSGVVVARDRSYHGASYACAALSGDERTRGQVDPRLFGFAHVPPPYAYRCPFGSESAQQCGELAAEAVAAEIDRHGASNVAAVIMEPDAGTNGIVAPDSYWPALRSVTRSREILLIADEVMSGFGRCGQWFAWQRYGEDGRPDIMTLAKGLTGAHLPLGAVLVTAQVAARIEHQFLATGLTYSGHPLCCAAGLAALRAYRDQDLVARSRRLGGRMFSALEAMQERHAVIGEVRGGHGLFAVIELVSDRRSRKPLAPWPQLPAAVERLLQAALAEGVSFAARGNLILLAPPLVIEDSDLDHAMFLLDRLLTELELP